MNTAKAEALAIPRSLPKSSSLEDIQYHLYVLENVRKGIERVGTEGAVLHKEAKKRLSKWLDA